MIHTLNHKSYVGGRIRLSVPRRSLRIFKARTGLAPNKYTSTYVTRLNYTLV